MQQSLSVPEFRSQICHSLITAGITAEKEIIAKATALEQFIFGEAAPVQPVNTPVQPTVQIPTPTPETVKEPEPEVTTTVEEPETNVVMQHQTVDVSAAKPVETHTGEQPVYTLKNVKEALLAVASKNPTAKKHTEILEKFGAAKVSDLKESDFAAVIATANKMSESM